MSTRTLRTHTTTRSASTAGPKETRAPTARVPSMKTVARRLAAVTAADMPWLRKDVDLTPLDGGPEVCGSTIGPSSRKERINVRIDADVLGWFKATGKGYQARMNEVLRDFVESRRRVTR